MICVAIANETIKAMIENSKIAIESGANLIEIRLDYLKIKHFNDNIFSELKTIIDFSVPVIFTYRKWGEGGQQQIDEEFRLRIIEKLITLCPTYIDLEFEIEKTKLESLISKCHENNIKVILSYHNFIKTPDLKTIELQLNSMKKFNPEIIKLIFMANNKYDNNIIFNLLHMIDHENFEIVAFCMGRFGIISRILSPFLGAKFTFASLNIKTAPGQITIQEMKQIHEIIEKNLM
ncbi:MAG: type I 3-dehydroquinate dehydratase [Candidatus Helarchaeota archaeon]